MTEHDCYGELAGPYALNILGADDRRAFEAHLAGCPECRAEVRDAAIVAETLGHAVTPEEPPAELRSRVLAAAFGADQSTVPASRVVPMRGAPVARPPRRRLEPWLLAAASFAAVALGLYSLSLRARLRETDQALRSAQARLAATETQMASLERTSSESSRVALVASAPDVVRVDMAGQADAPAARGRAFGSPSRGIAVAADQLPALPQGRVYQLWLVTADAKVSAGLMHPDASGRALSASQTTGVRPVAIALTLEPEGGVPAPTGAIYLVGSL